MNFRLVFSLLTMLSGIALAANFAPVQAEVKQVHVYQPELYSIRQGGIIFNQMARYALTLTQSKSDGTKAPQMGFTLSAGTFGFSPLIQFFKIKINGIEMKQLAPKAEDLRLWQEQDKAGCELKLNFDGVRLILRFYLRPDSPVLWGSLLPTTDTLEAMEKGEVEICLIPSLLAMNKQKPIWNGGYARMAITPLRTIETNPKLVPLTPTETYLIVQDRIFDGSTAEKGRGPCLIQLDYQSIEKAALRVNDDWTSAVSLSLKADFKEFRFGLWQQEPRIANADFLQKFQTEKAAFSW